MRAVCFAVVVCAALSVSLAAAAAPSVVTENGRLVLEVPEGTAVEVRVSRKAEKASGQRGKERRRGGEKGPARKR